jgi:hypothetical protein
MQFKGRALYNLLKITAKGDPSLKVEGWQILDYRALSVEEIFKKLFKLGIQLSKEKFLMYAESCASPEELAECMWIKEEDVVGEEKVYLLVFELWRRFLPGKETLSIFFDELDQLIFQFDDGMAIEDSAQSILFGLQDILDGSLDQGMSPQEAAASVFEYAAHDVESFLYDYISELLEEGLETVSSKLIDAFALYMADKKWFSLLRARLLALSNIEELDGYVVRLLEEAEESPDLLFLQEVADFVIDRDDSSLFTETVKQMLPLLKTKEDLEELLVLIGEFHKCHDRANLEQEVSLLIEKCQQRSPEELVSPSDLQIVENLLISGQYVS